MRQMFILYPIWILINLSFWSGFILALSGQPSELFFLHASFAVWWRMGRCDWCCKIDCLLYSNACVRRVLAGFSMKTWQHSCTKPNHQRAPFTNASLNAFTTTFMKQKYSETRLRWPQIWTTSWTTFLIGQWVTNLFSGCLSTGAPPRDRRLSFSHNIQLLLKLYLCWLCELHPKYHIL